MATQWIHTFSPNVLHELRFGINNWGDNYINPRTGTDFDVDSLGIGKFRVATDKRVKTQFRAEAFNAFNTPYFGQPTNIGFVTHNSITPDAPRMGEIRSLRASMRVLQFGIKISF